MVKGHNEHLVSVILMQNNDKTHILFLGVFQNPVQGSLLSVCALHEWFHMLF